MEKTREPITANSLDAIYRSVVLNNSLADKNTTARSDSSIGRYSRSKPQAHQEEDLTINSETGYGLSTGQAITTTLESILPKFLLPTAAKAVSVIGSAFGGIYTLATSGRRIIDMYRQEKKAESQHFVKTRREIVVTAAESITAMGLGATVGTATAATLSLGAPLAAAVGVGALGLLGVGIGISKAHDAAASWYDKVYRNVR